MRYLLLLTLFACSPDPLKRGAYTITMTDFTNDTCGYTDEIAGVGTTWEAKLSWDGDDIVIEEFQADTSYEKQGEYWAAASDSARETGVCIESFDEEHELVIVDETTFEIDAERRLGRSGNCDGVVTPAPCGYSLVYSGVRD